MSPNYQLKPDPFSSHSLIARELMRISQWICEGLPCTVLDLGCSEGFVGALLPVGRFSLIGVDHDRTALEKLPPIYSTRICADIETSKALDAVRFNPDVLVFADVLEHTRNPDLILQQAMSLLKPGGYIIISLPNVANLVVRLSLLFGKFDYAERGILDRTHLRFFTMHSARQMCDRCGMEIESILVTPVPLPLIHPLFGEGRELYFIHVVNAALTRMLKNLLAYQVICIGRKRQESNNQAVME